MTANGAPKPSSRPRPPSSEPPELATHHVDHVEAVGPAPEPAASSTRYDLLHRHARGGTADIFVARDRELGRTVAVKALRAEHEAKAGSRRQFLAEAEITGRLEHPGVVPVHGLGRDPDGRLYYAMRFVEGQNLRQAIAALHAAGPPEPAGVPFRQLVQKVIQVCNTLAYAHSRGVLHRDVKPQNILLGRFGEVLIADWGLAKPLVPHEPAAPAAAPGDPLDRDTVVGGQSSPTIREGARLGAILGTPAYMSPEQADAQDDTLGPACDVYGLGATLYTLLVGTPPFSGDDIPSVLRKVRAGAFAPPRQARPAVPRALDAICLKAMALDPAARYASPLDLAADLDHWLADESVAAHRDTFGDRLRRWMTRHRTLATVALTTLTVTVLALLVSQQAVLQHQHSTAEALHETRHAQQVSEQQRQAAQAERDRADANAHVAEQALDAALTKLADHPRLQEGEMAAARREVVRAVLPNYELLVGRMSGDGAAALPRVRALLRLAELRLDLGDRDAALGNCRAAEAALATLPADAGRAAEQVRAAKLRARLEQQRGRLDAAEAALRAGLAVAPPTGVDRAALQVRLGTVLASRGRDADAATAFRDVIALTDNRAGGDERATALTGLADLHRAAGRPADAETALRVALDMRQALLAVAAATPQRWADVAATRAALGDVLLSAGRPGDAETELRAALAVREQLAREFPGADCYRHAAGRTHDTLGVALLDRRRFDDAERCFGRALPPLERAAADSPEDPAAQRAVAAVHAHVGRLHEARGQKALAEAAYGRAAQAQGLAVARSPHLPDARRDLAATHVALAKLVAPRKRPREAEQHWRQALAQREVVARGVPTAADARELATTAAGLADCLTARGAAAEAADVLGRAVTVLQAQPPEPATNHLLAAVAAQRAAVSSP